MSLSQTVYDSHEKTFIIKCFIKKKLFINFPRFWTQIFPFLPKLVCWFLQPIILVHCIFKHMAFIITLHYITQICQGFFHSLFFFIYKSFVMSLVFSFYQTIPIDTGGFFVFLSTSVVLWACINQPCLRHPTEYTGHVTHRPQNPVNDIMTHASPCLSSSYTTCCCREEGGRGGGSKNGMDHTFSQRR